MTYLNRNPVCAYYWYLIASLPEFQHPAGSPQHAVFYPRLPAVTLVTKHHREGQHIHEVLSTPSQRCVYRRPWPCLCEPGTYSAHPSVTEEPVRGQWASMLHRPAGVRSGSVVPKASVLRSGSEGGNINHIQRRQEAAEAQCRQKTWTGSEHTSLPT